MVLMAALATLTTILVSVVQFLNPWDDWNGVCYNPACKNAANKLIRDSNPDVKPCDNFYQFACGNFMAGINVKSPVNSFGRKAYEIDTQIRSILQQKPKLGEPRIFRSVKQYYDMCMDEQKMDDRGAAPGVAILKKLGGWPVLGNWDAAKWDIFVPQMRAWHLGLDGDNLIPLSIGVELTDLTKYVFKLQQPELPIPREYLIEGEGNSMVKEYFQYMVDMAILYGADIHTALQAMKKVLQLQIEIAKVVVPEEELRGTQQQFKQFTLKELDDDLDKFLDWRKLLEGIVSPIKLQDDQKIDIFDLEVIKKIIALINGYPPEVIANYIMWNFAKAMSPYLTTAMRNRKQRLEQVLQGITGRPPRWMECITELEGLSLVVSALYVNKFFDKSSRIKAKDMTKRIQNEMDKVLLEADWMDERTREKARQKSAKMHHVIGYPDELADITKVEEHYKELNLNKEHFFEARLELNIYVIKDHVRKLKEVSVKRPWTAYSKIATSNAHYWRPTNSIVLTAGILQEPFFSASFPSYLNYAKIGFLFGHEITHGFDDEGREFDDEGELKEWWDEASLNKFNEKKQCFIDQYSSFIESVTKRNVNGIITQEENIADNGGLKLAFRAYRRVADQLKYPEPRLPGLKHYNNDQLFFISFANTWCSVRPFQFIEHSLLTDGHAPSEWRVNGMVMNMPQFGEIFGCDKGTPMNPVEKCEVW